jgi:putative ABC transport system permease protein
MIFILHHFMTWNYLLVALRSIRKNALYSLINIGGLALGLCVCMLILVYVAHEHSYDQFHKDSDRIFRVNAEMEMNGQKTFMTGLSYTAAPTAKAADPRIAAYMQVFQAQQPVPFQSKSNPHALFSESRVLFADSNFFSFFSFPLREGSPTGVLNKPLTVVLSQSAAHKYFGNTDPVGQLLTFHHDYTLEVTGVASDAPSNSSIQYDFVIPISSWAHIKEFEELSKQSYFGVGMITTYLLLTHPEAAPGVAKSLDALNPPGDKDDLFSHVTYDLDLFKDTHLGLNFGDFSNIKYLKIFPLIAGLVLLLALINYVSLATARATTRAKEIGVRKTMGASRKTVAFQFYVESAVMATLAFVLGYVFFRLAQPYSLRLLHLNIDTAYLYTPRMLILFGALLLFTILVAGCYPSLVLSSYNPVAVLSGKLSRRRGGTLVRKVLMVGQFTISIALIGCSLIMNQQIDFFHHKDTGLSRDQVVSIPFSAELAPHFTAFRQEVAAQPGVIKTASVVEPLYGPWSAYFINQGDKHSTIPLDFITASTDFMDLMGMQWKYAPRQPLETYIPARSIIINEEALKKFHINGNPLEQTLALGNEDTDRAAIIGVLKNFNFRSLEYPMDGLGIRIDNVHSQNMPVPGYLYVKLSKGAPVHQTLDRLRNIYAKYDPTTPFEFRFMDDIFNDLYASEDRLVSMLSVFTLLTIVIACLGLLGLAAYSMTQRTKEISIRKVLGAGIQQLLPMLSKDFFFLILLSMVLAIPLGWYAMHQWLNNFENRITLRPWAFLGAGLIAILLAVFTVSTQALRAIRANLVDALRKE